MSSNRRSRVSISRCVRVAATATALVAVALASQIPALAADTFLVTGRGYGHGIGLSQWGAKGYADRGWTYGQILTHFYQSTTVPARSGVSAGTVKVNLDPKANYTAGSSTYNAGYTRTSFKLSPGHAGGRLVVNGTSLAVDTAYVFTPSGTSVKVRNAAAPSTGASLTISNYANVTETGAAFSLVRVAEASGNYGRANQRYRGILRVTPNGSATSPRVKVVNYLPMDSYLYGVVPGESPSSWPAEALKAQAVAARSYAVTTGGEMYCTTRHQVYLGYEGEAASTNAAIKATPNRVVYFSGTYGGASHSEVVRTFFSSSSGGRTASIQDVWTGSSPRPYYRTVADADIGSGSSYAKSWGPAIAYTGSTLASKLRSHGSSYTRPSPAIVTAVGITRAASGSGFAQYVNLTWSDGQKTRPTGDWFRGALGLRSTKFFVTKKTNITRIQQDNPKLTWTGSWRTGTGVSHSGRSYKWSRTKGSTSTIKFTGTGIALIAPKASSYGRANVYVDGTYKGTISLYSSRVAYHQRVFAISRLATGKTHTLTVKVTGTKVPASRGVTVGIDAFDITSGAIQ